MAMCAFASRNNLVENHCCFDLFSVSVGQMNLCHNCRLGDWHPDGGDEDSALNRLGGVIPAYLSSCGQNMRIPLSGLT